MSVPSIYFIDDDPLEFMSFTRSVGLIDAPLRHYELPLAFLMQCPEDATGCVIADLMMPQLSGLELLNRLRDRGIRMPFILRTGLADPSARTQATSHGVFDFLEKDLDPTEMRKSVERALAEN